MAADPGLAEYLAVIEQALARQLGREHVLSPPDFRLAREWHAAGLPLATLLAGLEAAFAAGFEPRSLQACRRFVERDWRAERARAGTINAAGAPEEPLRALVERLESLAAAGDGAFAACAAEARALVAQAPGQRAAGRDALALRVTAAARACLGPLDEQAARREAERALRRQAGLPETERAAALERHLTRRALERLGLVGLL